MRKSALQGVGAMITSEVLREWFPLSSQPVRAGKRVFMGFSLRRGLTPAAIGLTTLAVKGSPFLCPRRETAAEAKNG